MHPTRRDLFAVAAGAIGEAQQQMWQLALHLEEGQTERTAQALEEARQAARDALDKAIREPTEANREALEQRLKELEEAIERRLGVLHAVEADGAEHPPREGIGALLAVHHREAVLGPGAVGERAQAFDFGLELGQLELHPLLVGQRAAEQLALLRPLDGPRDAIGQRHQAAGRGPGG